MRLSRCPLNNLFEPSEGTVEHQTRNFIRISAGKHYSCGCSHASTPNGCRRRSYKHLQFFQKNPDVFSLSNSVCQIVMLAVATRSKIKSSNGNPSNLIYQWHGIQFAPPVTMKIHNQISTLTWLIKQKSFYFLISIVRECNVLSDDGPSISTHPLL